jgi:hypothetical protein
MTEQNEQSTPPNSQRAPDTLSTQAENELICEKLLRWNPVRACRNRIKEWLDTPYGDDGAQWHTVVTPSFTHWAEAGLILEALSSHCPTLEYSDGKWDCYGGDPFESFFHAYADTAPLAIRAAALEHIRRQP